MTPLLDEAFKEAGYFKFENMPLYFKAMEGHLLFEILWTSADYPISLEGFLKEGRINKMDAVAYFRNSGVINQTMHLTYGALAGYAADMYFGKDGGKFEYWKDVYQKLTNKKYL